MVANILHVTKSFQKIQNHFKLNAYTFRMIYLIWGFVNWTFSFFNLLHILEIFCHEFADILENILKPITNHYLELSWVSMSPYWNRAIKQCQNHLIKVHCTIYLQWVWVLMPLICRCINQFLFKKNIDLNTLMSPPK